MAVGPIEITICVMWRTSLNIYKIVKRHLLPLTESSSIQVPLNGEYLPGDSNPTRKKNPRFTTSTLLAFVAQFTLVITPLRQEGTNIFVL